MATIEELLAMAKSAKDTPLPDTFADDLETSVLLAMESRDATIELKDKEIKTLDGKVKAYAVQNLDLIRNAPAEKQEPKDPVKTPLELQREKRAEFDRKLKEL